MENSMTKRLLFSIIFKNIDFFVKKNCNDLVNHFEPKQALSFFTK